MNAIKIEQETISSLESLGIKLYSMPDGTFSIEIQEASKALGYENNWLEKTIFNKDNFMPVPTKLWELGFTKKIKKTVKIVKEANRKKIISVYTITLEDFNCLLIYEGCNGNYSALKTILKLEKIVTYYDFKILLKKQMSCDEIFARKLLDIKYENNHQLIMEHIKIEKIDELETEDDIISLALSITS